ncbi:uncharacterized protein LACBIDRAFT_308547 [Laccaria bicolor S238N-H82]|uniref:Predicted protein n=1 Tax=Laccaria bicolor (strain S238N-H82 / ATCC MYA-4686) TaxID=486041 RepID=B0CWM2_LACBS|nr:uncharacterized protein LACBIDRAFT_308547 [Laccaria bicolor S238N-H82]EDR13092.1 predicted protein [Laccaria bicolor S238N-H82]|eukprot:XP_001875590.1 predicted protein [Laccaria bicolor S238N-H82]
MATQLLKLVAEYGFKIGDIEVEIAWTFIASLISLGPNFVPPHSPKTTRPLAESLVLRNNDQCAMRLVVV